MCGICGFVRLGPGAASQPGDRERLEAMAATLVHRGPDDLGLALHQGAALGMRRLAIIDLAGGAQPIYSEDRQVWTVFNGEIYNFPALRAELEGLGHCFATRADTEVIVHGYEEWGEEMVSRLNGMFALALHDRRRGRLLLARDHLGVKPLYFLEAEGCLWFGSEIKAILAGWQGERRLDLQALADFLSWEYVPGPATLIQGIRKLGPGELMAVDQAGDRGAAIRAYWDVPLPAGDGRDLPAAAWEERILDQARRSVRMQMISDVPLGAFLSGGVDSSLVTALMRQEHGAPVRTFSIGFDDPSYNELHWARRVAAHLGVEHRDEIIRPDVLDLFGRLMHCLDDPIGDFSIFPTFLVSRLARNEVTVVLSGDGGDELFAGYEVYVAQDMARLYQRLPAFLRQGLVAPLARRLRPGPAKKGLRNKVRRFVEGASLPAALGHARWRLFVGQELRQALFTPEALAAMPRPVEAHILERQEAAGERSALDRALYVDVKTYLCDNILAKVDRMAMAVSLESRVPLLDPDLVALAFAVPAELKLEGRETKAILKRVAARLVPAECVYRPKEGFSIPIKHWLNHEFRPLVDDLLGERAIRDQGIFRWPVIERLLREHRGGRENHSHILWALVVFQEWRRRWLGG